MLFFMLGSVLAILITYFRKYTYSYIALFLLLYFFMMLNLKNTDYIKVITSNTREVIMLIAISWFHIFLVLVYDFMNRFMKRKNEKAPLLFYFMDAFLYLECLGIIFTFYLFFIKGEIYD